MHDLIFVYGSLLGGSGHPMSVRLGGEAALVGEASFAGRLYRVSWYPGAVECPGEKARVWGEVHRLAEPAVSLAWLDAYEGVEPGDSSGREYDRVLRPVLMADGTEVTAWIYLYTAGVDGRPEVPGGRWLQRQNG